MNAKTKSPRRNTCAKKKSKSALLVRRLLSTKSLNIMLSDAILVEVGADHGAASSSGSWSLQLLCG